MYVYTYMIYVQYMGGLNLCRPFRHFGSRLLVWCVAVFVYSVCSLGNVRVRYANRMIEGLCDSATCMPHILSHTHTREWERETIKTAAHRISDTKRTSHSIYYLKRRRQHNYIISECCAVRSTNCFSTTHSVLLYGYLEMGKFICLIHLWFISLS